MTNKITPGSKPATDKDVKIVLTDDCGTTNDLVGCISAESQFGEAGIATAELADGAHGVQVKSDLLFTEMAFCYPEGSAHFNTCKEAAEAIIKGEHPFDTYVVPAPKFVSYAVVPASTVPDDRQLDGWTAGIDPKDEETILYTHKDYPDSNPIISTCIHTGWSQLSVMIDGRRIYTDDTNTAQEAADIFMARKEAA